MCTRNIVIFVKNLTSGGAEKQSILLAKALASSNYKVHYIVFNAQYTHQKYIDMILEENRISLNMFEGGLFERIKLFRAYLVENQITHIFSYLTAANFFASIVSYKLPTKVYTGIRNARLPYIKLVIDRFLTNHFAESTIANCFSGKNFFSSKGFDNNKIIVIPNCFENIKPFMPKNTKKLTSIITVGRFVPQKDYLTAIRSIEILKKQNSNIQFIIVGYGKLENKIRYWIKKHNIEDITKVYINPDNISELLDSSDIYLSTSLFEGTSNSIMEAMNADLPIVATNVGDNKYLVKHEHNGYICNIKDINGIAEKLFYLAENATIRYELGKASKQYLINKYSMKKFTESYNQVILK